MRCWIPIRCKVPKYSFPQSHLDLKRRRSSRRTPFPVASIVWRLSDKPAQLYVEHLAMLQDKSSYVEQRAFFLSYFFHAQMTDTIADGNFCARCLCGHIDCPIEHNFSYVVNGHGRKREVERPNAALERKPHPNGRKKQTNEKIGSLVDLACRPGCLTRIFLFAKWKIG